LPTGSVEARHRLGFGSVLKNASLAVVLMALGAAVSPAQPEVFVVDGEASQVRIHLGRAGLLKFLGHEHEIDAPVTKGRVDVDMADPTRSRVDLFWEAPLLALVPGTEPEKDVPEVEERMRGPEVLEVETYPGIRFWSFEVHVEDARPESGAWRLRVRGGLELKGARHTVEIPLDVRRDGATLVATGEVELRLSHIGIEPPSVAGVVNVSDKFRLAFEVHAEVLEPQPEASSTSPS